MERHSTISNTLYVFLLLLIPCSLLLSSCKEDEKNAVELKGKPLQITADIQYLGEDGTYRLEGGESVGLWVSSLENSLSKPPILTSAYATSSLVAIPSGLKKGLAPSG